MEAVCGPYSRLGPSRLSTCLPRTTQLIATEKKNQIQYICQALFPSTPDWAIFYREVLGPKGIVRQMFPTRAQRAQFRRTETYAEIQRMLAELRRKGPLRPHHEELTDTITVRLPRCVYDALSAEAKEHRTTLNQLCISKLLQPIDKALVPEVAFFDRIPRKKRRQANL